MPLVTSKSREKCWKQNNWSGSKGVPDVDEPREQNLMKRVADHAANEAAVRRAVQQAVLEHARAGLPVATWKDGKVHWLQPNEVLALLAEANGNGEPGANAPGSPADSHHPNRSDS